MSKAGVQNVRFGAEISKWVSETEDRLKRVFHLSAQNLLSEMQTSKFDGGLIPIDTGFMRASVVVNVNGEFPLANRPNPTPRNGGVRGPEIYQFDLQPAALAIASASPGDKINIGYTAEYAPYVEYGTSRTKPQPWVRPAAARWQIIVNAACAEARAAADKSKSAP